MAASANTLWFDTVLLPSGWADDVRIRATDGRIATIDVGVNAAPNDERHAIGLPGLPNLHSHAFQRGMAGLTETRGPTADSFWTWREVMYRFVGRMSPGDVEAIAAFAFAEMLEAGFTQVGEFHYLHHGLDGEPYDDLGELSGRIVAAATATGIGLTLLPVFYAHGDFGGAATGPGQRRFLNDLDRFARLRERAEVLALAAPDTRIGVAPHSLRAVTPDELKALATLAPGDPVHIHIAEQLREVEACLAWSGRRPVEWLLDNAEVDARWCLVHATHMSPEETRRFAASGAVAGLCPITEANLGDGVFPALAFAGAGGRWGIGSDSNVVIDAAGELRMLEYSQRLSLRARNLMAGAPGRSTGAGLFAGALAGGAQALGQEGAGLVAGAPLDLVSLNSQHPFVVGCSGDTILDAWIFANRSGAIDCVWRGGRKLVETGRHRQIEPIRAAYRRTLKRLVAS